MHLFTILRLQLTLLFILCAFSAFSEKVAIIESQSFHPLQNMDAKWEAALFPMGHASTILPQSTLNDISNLVGFDILIVSNGLINLTDTQEETILQFVSSGRGAYVQAEYQVTQPGSEAFQYVVTELGGTFSWTGEMNGNLAPMNVIGDIGTMNIAASSINHFWYGAYGVGDENTEPFLEYNGQHFGFVYTSPDPTHGKVMTTSDQDWIRLDHSPEMMQNIIYYLLFQPTIDIPSIFVSVSDSQPCDTEPVTFTANVGTTNANIGYQWLVNGNPVLGATQAAFTSVFNSGDLVNCEIIFTLGSASEMVLTPELEVITITTIGSTPTIEITTENTSICANETVTALAETTMADGINATYQWTLNGVIIPGAISTTLQINTLNDGDVIVCTIQYDDPCGGTSQVASNDLVFSVTALATPTITITSDFANICAGESVNFSATTTDGGNNPTYQWMVDGINVGTNTSTFNTSNLTDAQVVTCLVTSSYTCVLTPTATSNDITMNVSIPVTPAVTIQADQTIICVGETVSFTASGTDLGSNPQFEWFVDGVTTSLNNTTFTPNFLTNGQEVTCQVTTAETCVTSNVAMSSAISIEVNSSTTPTLNIISDATSICFGGSVTFTATGEHLGQNPQYDWLINGTTTGNTTATFVADFTNEQTITCIVTAMDDCAGLQTATSNEIEITIGTLLLDVTEVQPETCDNQNGVINLQAGGGVGPYTYNWDNNLINTNTNKLTNLSAGNYSVVVSDVNGCSAEMEINVPFITAPEFASVEANNMSCQSGGNASVIMNDPTEAYFYAWKNADNKTISNSPQIDDLEEGLYLIEVSNAYGCAVTEEIYIQFQAPIQVEILEETTIELGNEYKLQVVTNYPTATFTWKADKTLSCEDCMTPTIKPTRTTTYFVTATTADGCSASAHVTIQVAKPRNVFVPNAFSPNNDGQNDRFTIYGGDDVVKVKTFQIFDRWGSIVYANTDFHVNDESAGWNGNIQNKKTSEGVFIYYAEIEFIDGHTELYKGDVTITR